MKKILQKAGMAKSNLASTAIAVATALEGGDLVSFTQFSPGLFPVGFPETLREAVTVIDNLPDGRKRQEALTNALINMNRMLPNLLAFAKQTGTFIQMAFPASEYKQRLAQSGYSAYYISASKKNWSDVLKLGTNLTQFVQDFTSILSVNDIMPKVFPSEMKTAFEAFAAEKTIHDTAKTNITNATNDNVEKINELIALLTLTFKSAQSIFQENKVKRSFYRMANFARALRPGTTGAIRGSFYDEVSKLPIVGGKVSMPYHNFEAKTNQKGRFLIENLPEGNYMLVFEAAGFPVFQQASIKVRTGSKRTLKPMYLQALPADVLADAEKVLLAVGDSLEANVVVDAAPKVLEKKAANMPAVELPNERAFVSNGSLAATNGVH